MKFNEDNKELKSVCSYKVKTCLKCHAKTDDKDEREFFCSECGAPVLNKCSSYECDEILSYTAKFCKYCGSRSVFYNYGLLDDTAPKFLVNTDDLPF